MARPHGPRFTILRGMTLVAVAAVVLASPRLAGSVPRTVVRTLAGAAAAFVVLHAALELALRRRCPACSHWPLRRLARHQGYYRCGRCLARFRRRWLGPWADASGPGDDWRYRAASAPRPWRGFAVPEALDGSTSGALLREKRARGGRLRPSAPPGAGGRPGPTRDGVRRALRRMRALRGDPAEPREADPPAEEGGPEGRARSSP